LSNRIEVSSLALRLRVETLALQLKELVQLRERVREAEAKAFRPRRCVGRRYRKKACHVRARRAA